MDSSMSTAMGIALEHIFLHDYIDERHTLLTGRLVCRTWRTSFSSKITSVTLRTLADVQRAADYLPREPSQRPPWPSAEESRVFPQLKTLRVSEALALLLYESSSSRDVLASIQIVEVDLVICEWGGGHESKLHTLAGLLSSVYVSWEFVDSVDEILNARNIAAFSRLTRLTTCGGFTISSLPMLSGVGSLRHLQLIDLPVSDDTELAKCLTFGAALTQLTRLDIKGNMDKKSHCRLERMIQLVKDCAPVTLHDFEIWFWAEALSGCGFQLRTSLADGVLKFEHGKSDFTVNSSCDFNESVSCHLSKIPQHSLLTQELTINLPYEFPKTELHFDLTKATALEKLGLALRYNNSHVSAADRLLASSYAQDGSATAPSARSIRPTFVSEEGVQMAALRLDFDATWLSSKAAPNMDLNSMAQGLSRLFPHLCHLKLSVFNHGFQYPDHLSQLTKLTHLTIEARWHDATIPLFSPACFPPSLRELVIHADHMKLPPLSGLEHLTKLTLCDYVPNGTCTLDAVYGCRAPLRDLCLSCGLYGVDIDVPAVAKAFPDLEVLHMRFNSFDVSPLSSLRLLRDLTVILPGSDSEVLKGVDTLTTLSYLYVEQASECMDGLSSLVKLKQLRLLKYWIDNRSTLGTHYPREEYWRVSEEVAKKCRGPIEQLRQNMPHTEASIIVNGHDIEGWW